MSSYRLFRTPSLVLHPVAAALALGGLCSAGVIYVRADAAPGGSGSSWATAKRDLVSALASASGVDQVWVAHGTYKPGVVSRLSTFTVPSGVELYGGFAGNESSLDQRDLSGAPSILDGDLLGNDQPGFGNYEDNAFHVVTAEGVTFVRIDGFTVRGGSLGGGAGLRIVANSVHLANLVVEENWGLENNNYAGGAYVESFDATVERCEFSRNKATGGGGLYFLGNFADVEDCVFLDNVGTSGAGLQLYGFVGGVAEALVLRSRFEGNSGTDGPGVRATAMSRVTVEDSVFRSNAGNSGSGISIAAGGGIGHLFVSRSEFVGCTGTGGGILTNQGFLAVDHCRFVDCGEGSFGGGSIHATDGAELEITDTIFMDGRNASLHLEQASFGSVERCTFSTASGLSIRLRQQSSLSLESCIVWGAGTNQVFSQASTIRATYSDVHMGGSGLPGVGNLDVDPLFVSTAADDLHLSPSSPCIDAGDPLDATIGADFERDSRRLDGNLDGISRVDMGADEYGPVRLRVLGTRAVGNTLTFLTTGAPGLNAILMFGAPGLRQLGSTGTLFTAAAGLQTFNWASTPSSLSAVVPPAALGLTFHVQELCFGGGRSVVTNYVPLEF